MKSIFSRNEDYEKIAFVNWRISGAEDITNVLNLADGFLLSAIELAKHSLENNQDKKADILIFPILTNANHGIELYLKAISWTLNRLLNNNRKFEVSHNIKQIFDTVRARINEYNGGISLKEFDESMVEVKGYIDELFQKINATPQNDKMDFSRYPFNNKFENHFYVEVLGNVEIDLEKFVEGFSLIHEKLEILSDFLYYQELNKEYY